MTTQYNNDRKLTIIAATTHIKQKYITQQIHTALQNFLQLYSFVNTDFTHKKTGQIKDMAEVLFKCSTDF